MQLSKVMIYIVIIFKKPTEEGNLMIMMLKSMKKKKSGIPAEVISIFEEIIHQYDGGSGVNLTGVKCDNPDWDSEFSRALKKAPHGRATFPTI
jgi:hypothetical protein